MPTHRSALRPHGLLLALLAACIAGPAAAQTVKTELHSVRASTVLTGLVQPWGMAWLPDGRMLITEKRGTLRVVRDGRLVPEPVAGLPKSTVQGQGGLMDVTVHPDFAKTGWVYWSYNGEQDGQHGTEVARGKLSADGARLSDVQVIFRMRPCSGATVISTSRWATAAIRPPPAASSARSGWTTTPAA
jgi:aldose sugar dehydrogenase